MKSLFSLKNKYVLLLPLFCVLFSQCSDEDVIRPSSDFQVSVKSEFSNTLYPSFIFGLTEIEKLQGETMDYFSITIKPNTKSNIRIVIEESDINNETIITQNNVSGETKIIPAIKWKYNSLMNLNQPGNVDITFVLYLDGTEVNRKNLRLSYRAIQECVLIARLDNQVIPLYWMMGGYVNEDSPVIDPFLQEVLTTTNLEQFDGYQSNNVHNQVAAMFITLREKGIKYSSITATSNTNPNIVSQYIRFADEVLTNTQANCADGTAFFCSALKKVGISTIMVFVPGHVYLGYYTDAAKTSLFLLETTAVGNVSFTFADAVDYQVENFNSNLDKFNNGDMLDGYFFIDIDNARQIIKPIGR